MDIQELLAIYGPGANGSPAVACLLAAGDGLLLSPILGLAFFFGEEYGWRGYLQGELVKVGKVRGLLLVGVIWGLWHTPVILMGYNFPGYPVAGSVLMVLVTIVLAFLFGFAVLKTGSVWLAAFLHGLNNNVIPLLFAFVYRPDSPVFAFGWGVLGFIYPVNASQPFGQASRMDEEMAEQQSALKILVVDDQPRSRKSLMALLSTWPRAFELHQAGSGREAAQMVDELQPDLVLMDVRMADVDGLGATRTIKSRWPRIKVIVLSMHLEHRNQALAAGADAFVGKGKASEKLLDLLAAVMHNEV